MKGSWFSLNIRGFVLDIQNQHLTTCYPGGYWSRKGLTTLCINTNRTVWLSKKKKFERPFLKSKRVKTFLQSISEDSCSMNVVSSMWIYCITGRDFDTKSPYSAASLIYTYYCGQMCQETALEMMANSTWRRDVFWRWFLQKNRKDDLFMILRADQNMGRNQDV